VQLEIPEDDPLRVETCSVTQINKSALTVERVLLAILHHSFPYQHNSYENLIHIVHSKCEFNFDSCCVEAENDNEPYNYMNLAVFLT
jgi:hypothetical protein